MKPTATLSSLLAIAASSVLAISHTQATTLYFDGGAVDIAGDGDGASALTSAGGTWDTTTLNWDAGAVPYVAWNNANGDDAVITGSGGGNKTISIATPVTVGALTITHTAGTLFMSGSEITINSGINFNNPAGLTWTAPIKLGGDQTWSIGGTNSTAKRVTGGTDLNGHELTWDGGLTNNGTPYHEDITGNGSIVKDGTGNIRLRGTNSYTGSTTVNDGAINMESATALGNVNNQLTVNGGALNMGSQNLTVSNLTGTGGVITGSSGTRTLTIGSGNFQGVIEDGFGGTTALTKTGAGTLELRGSNSYSGPTTVTAGTLSLGDGTNNSNLDDLSAVSVDTGAKLDLNFSSGDPDAVLALFLGGSPTPAAAGTWGSTSSTATNQDNTYFSGTGVINNLGSTVSLGIAHWDGGSVDIVTDGNAASAGGSGTWDTTTANWDVGFTAHSAWLNTTSDEAVFGGSAGTVTVAEPVNLGDMTFDVSGNYTIDGSTLNFGAGATIRNSDNRYDQTITSAITGSPDVETKDFGAGNSYKGFIFAPTSGTQVLGHVLNPNNTGNTDKAGFAMGGSTTGNSVVSIDYAGGDKYGTVYKTGTSTWTTGDIRTGVLDINGSGGTLIVNGTVTADNSGIKYLAGTLSGDATLVRGNRQGNHDILSGFIVAPGNGIGTITVADGTSGTPNATQQFTIFRAGAIYEWEVGPANTTDTVHIAKGKLELEGFTLKIIDSGGTPGVSDRLPVFTYDPVEVTVRNLSLGSVVFGPLPAGWTGTPSLTDDNAGTIYFELKAPSAYEAWAAGFAGLTDKSAALDFEKGGLVTGIEYVVGGDPTAKDDASVAPTGTADGSGGLVFTFRRTDLANDDPDATIVAEYSTSLTSWTMAVDGTDGVSIVETNDHYGAGIDRVVVNLPSTLAAGGKLFARLKVTGLPDTLLEESFEYASIDESGFTIDTIGGSTWEWGVPNTSGLGGGDITTAADGAKCYGTNLTGAYAAGTETKLRSAVIDLRGVATATLSFAQAIDIESSHTLVVNVIEEATDTVLQAAVHTSTPDPDVNNAPWETVDDVSITGGAKIRIEWHFTGSGDGNWAGAYIDQVKVTTP